MASVNLLRNFDCKTGKYFKSENLMRDLNEFWNCGRTSTTRRNYFFHFRPTFLEKAEEIFHLYVLVEHFHGFDVIESDDCSVKKCCWDTIGSLFAKFRKSDNELISGSDLRHFYLKVILPCVRIAESSAASTKFNSPWNSVTSSNNCKKQLSVKQMIGELFGDENVYISPLVKKSRKLSDSNPLEGEQQQLTNVVQIETSADTKLLVEKEQQKRQQPKKKKCESSRNVKTNVDNRVIVLEQEFTPPSKSRRSLAAFAVNKGVKMQGKTPLDSPFVDRKQRPPLRELTNVLVKNKDSPAKKNNDSPSSFVDECNRWARLDDESPLKPLIYDDDDDVGIRTTSYLPLACDGFAFEPIRRRKQNFDL